MTFDEWLNGRLKAVRDIVHEVVEQRRQLRTYAADDDGERAAVAAEIEGCERRLHTEVTMLQRVIFALSAEKAQANYDEALLAANERVVSGLERTAASRDPRPSYRISDCLQDPPMAVERRARQELEGVEALERAISE